MHLSTQRQSTSIMLNPEHQTSDQQLIHLLKLKTDTPQSKSGIQTFLTLKNKTQRLAATLQTNCQIHNNSTVQSKITIITRNVQPLDTYRNNIGLEAIDEAAQKSITKKSKKRYFQNKLDEISYSIKSDYLKKYKLSKSIRLKVPTAQNQISKQRTKKWSIFLEEDKLQAFEKPAYKQNKIFSASLNLQTIYMDKQNKIAPKNIQKYHNDFQLLKCALQKKVQQKMSRIFDRQKQIQDERDSIKLAIQLKMRRNAHSMRAHKVQKYLYNQAENTQQKHKKTSLPKIKENLNFSYNQSAIVPRNQNQNKQSFNGEKQKATRLQSIYMNKNRIKTII